MLCAEHLSLRLENVDVLRGVTASFEKGSITFVNGPSGAGKTSLLRVLAGLERSASGCVTYSTTRWQSDSVWLHPWSRSIGFVAQDLALWPHLTVMEHITWPLQVSSELNATDRRARAHELLDFLELRQLAAR